MKQPVAGGQGRNRLARTDALPAGMPGIPGGLGRVGLVGVLLVPAAACVTARAPHPTPVAPARSAPVHAESAPEAQPDAGPVTAGPPAGPVRTGVPDEPVFHPGSIPLVWPHPEAPAPQECLTEAPHDELAMESPVLSPEQERLEREIIGEAEPTFDYPVETNPKVLAWVDYYANRNARRFGESLARSGRYLERFREIFAGHGVPRDLVFMAHVESAFKTTAYSRARAKGIFQFIAATGRRYGLRIDYWVDERSDPEKSAHASASYLRDLYDEFGDWYLALASYNAGEGKVRRALRRTGKRDFWSIARTRYLRRETRNYVPAVLATTLIAKQPHKHGFAVDPDPPIEYETVEVRGAADLRVLARCAGVDVAELKLRNPALRRGQTAPGRTTSVHVPPGTGAKMIAALEQLPRNERVLYARHRVRRGDTLSTIARAYGVTVRSIQETNGMGRRTLIREGRTLRIPTAAAGRYPVWETDARPGETVIHVVRAGDTLWEIARRYRTSTGAIAAQSGRSVRAPLQIGERLSVPVGGGGRRAAVGPAGATGSGDLPAVVRHRVRRGDTLWDLSLRHRTTPAAIAAASGIGQRDTLRIGSTLLVVPGVRSASRARQAVADNGGAKPTRIASAAPSSGGSGTRFHTVRRGDSLWRIASRYRTSVDVLCNLNDISPDATLYPGTRLVVRK